MASNNKKNLSTAGLKATFFDLFRDHTDDIVKMIESLASGQTEDVVNIETSIFQRIIMLNKTANSIDSLAGNIEALSALRTNDNSIKSNGIVKENGASNQKVSSESKIAATSVESSSVDSVHTAPGVAVASKPVGPSNSPSQVASGVISSPIQNTPNTSTSAKVIPSQQEKVLVPKTENVVQSNEVLKKAETNVATIPSSRVVENKESNGHIQFIKQSDKKAKAILVNTKQFGKLMASRQNQFGLLDFGSYSVEDVSSKIESLTKKASSLYKEGKIAEAQATIAEISALNKRIKQEQGRDKILMKRAA